MSVTMRPLDDDLLEPAFDLATRVFVSGSSLHRAMGITLQEYRAYLRPAFATVANEGLSVVACAEGHVQGCLIATDFHGQIGGTGRVPEKFAPLAALTATLRHRYPRTVVPGEAVLVDMAAVSADAAGQGIYREMRRAAAHLAHARGYRRVIGELSSAVTQHVVLSSLGHEAVAEVVFEDFEFGAIRPFRSITEPRAIVLAEGPVECGQPFPG